MSEVAYRQTLEIDLGQPSAAVGDLAGNLERLAKAEDDLRRLGRSLGGGGSSSRSLAPAREPRFFSGPNQRLQQIQAQQQRVGSIADPGERAAVEADLARREWLSRRQIVLDQRRRADPRALHAPGLLEIGGEANRLLGSLASGNMTGASRSLAILGTFNSALALAGAAAVGFGLVVREGIKYQREFNAARAASGGTARDVAGAASFGIPLGQLAGTAGGLRGRLSSDPLAMMASAQLGFGPTTPQWVGTQNNTRILMQHVEALRKVTNAEEQLRLARMLGLEGMVDMLRVSPHVFEGMKADAEVNGRALAGGEQSARDLGGQGNRLGANLGALGGALAQAVTPALGDVTEVLADAARVLTMVASPIAWGIGQLIQVVNPFHWATEIAHGINKLTGGTDAQKAQEDHTKAMEDHTTAMQRASNAGQRATGALPTDLRGEMLRRAIAGNAFRLGAIVP